MQLEEDKRNNGCGIKQVWMMFDGNSRPWDIGVDEQGRELKERWEKENGMAVGEVRLMADGRMIGWDDLANSADGTVEWERSLGRRRRRILGNRMGREFHLGLEKFLGQMAVQLKNSLMLLRKMN